MRGLIGDLEDEFTADDPRWARMGFDAPADIGMPDMVENTDIEEMGPAPLKNHSRAALQGPRSLGKPPLII